MAYEHILYERRGHAGVVTLNHPETMNRMSLDVLAEIRLAVDAAAEDPEVGAIVLAAAGRAFCAGASVSGFKERAAERDAGQEQSDLAMRVRHLRGPDSWVPWTQKVPKPTIVAVNGVCVGMGLTTILPLDIRIASEDARFGVVFVKLGLVPELTSTALLPRIVGAARALEWSMTGRLVPAAEALTAGLVSEVVPNERLLERALQLAEELSSKSQPSIQAIRTLVRENALEPDTFAILRKEVAALDELYRTPEHKESIAAFLEKRPPDFRR